MLIDLVTRSVEVAGVAVIIVGALIAAWLYAARVAKGDASAAYRALRSDLGRSILLGLELLVAADIINTVAVDPTVMGVALLGAIVLIRTFLSFAIEVELEGRWPWQRDRANPAGPGRDGH